MTQDQLLGILRAILAAAGGFFVAKGTISAETWTWIAGGVLTVGPAIWSWFTNRPSTMAATVQAMPGVSVKTSTITPAAVTEAVAAVKK